MSYLVSVLVLAAIACCCQGLECGVKEGLQRDEVQSAVTKCMIKSSFGSTESSEENGNATKNSSTKDRDSNESQNSTNYFSSKTKRDTSRSSDEERQNSTNSMSQKCVLKCIFSEMDMVDQAGYPDRTKVAQTLLKSAKNRELKDFLQDATDECFQLLEQGDKVDPCDYSANLVTCLAEKGRSNCADWQLTNVTMYT